MCRLVDGSLEENRNAEHSAIELAYSGQAETGLPKLTVGGVQNLSDIPKIAPRMTNPSEESDETREEQSVRLQR